MVEITDDYMRTRLSQAKQYSIVILKRAAAYAELPATEKIVWEHGRRNMALNASGELAAACPIHDDANLSGVGIFNRDPEAVRAIMAQDPGVLAGIFAFEIHPCRGFPRSSLP